LQARKNKKFKPFGVLEFILRGRMLRRIGNKAKIAHDIIQYFPKHEIYVEFFAGALGMFLNKPKIKYNFLNDLDNDVFNFWEVLKNNRHELEQKIIETPYCDAIFQYWRQNKETDKIWQAVRFVYLSNFSYLGKSDTLKFGVENSKKLLLSNLTKTFNVIQDCQFMNCDFREVLNKISLKDEIDKQKTFLYCDPPYTQTNDIYSNSFTLQDTRDLFEICVNSGLRFAISEFQNNYVLELAKEFNLRVIPIKERQTLKKRNTEILIINYEIHNTLF
jgi:DNA adenine methylase